MKYAPPLSLFFRVNIANPIPSAIQDFITKLQTFRLANFRYKYLVKAINTKNELYGTLLENYITTKTEAF